MPEDNYVITSHGGGMFDVYNESNGSRYAVDMRTGVKSCNCPHWRFRIRKLGVECKHHKLIKEKGAWND